MLELTLPDMTCGHCVATVKRTVATLDPNAQVEVDLPSHQVRIQTQLEAEQVRKALEEEGYPAAA